MKFDAKTIAAIAALVTAIGGGVELRMQVGLLSAKVDRIEAELRRPPARLAGRHDQEDEQAGEKTVGSGRHITMNGAAASE